MKRILSIILAVIIMAVPMCLGAMAADSETNDDDSVAPRYQNLTEISAGISEGILGFVNCTSDFLSYETDKTFVLTCYLQRTDENSGWSNYKSESETFSGKGIFSINKSWFAPAGYAYRVYTKLQVKNSAGTIVETATIASYVVYK